MKLLLIIASVLLSLTSFSGVAFGATLQKVRSYAKDGAFYTELSFDQDVSADMVSLDYINETVQVNLSQTSMDKSISTKVSDDKVSSVYTYRLDNGSVRSRIIYKKGIQASEFQNSTTSEVQGNKIIVKVVDRVPASVAQVSDKVSDEDMAQAAQWIESADKKSAEEEVKIAAANAQSKALENKKESEIPVLAAKTESVEKKGSSTSRIILSLGLVLGLLFGFSVFLKKFLRKTPLKKNSQIKVLTQHYLGPKKSLAIIRVAGESMLIGVTDNNINLIKTLALLDEEIPQDTPRDFSKSLDQSMGLNAAADDEAEEFSISKIKDFVSGRLKNMKEL
ncbi:MAG: flagellar biosynthetic protein FliO [Bdellovibrionota bacterium]